MNLPKACLDILSSPPQKQLQLLQELIAKIDDPLERERIETFVSLARCIPQAPETILVLIHGIRTDAVWHDDLQSVVEAEGVKIKKIVQINFGFFSTPRFLWWGRGKALDHVTEQLRVIKSDYPTDRFVVIAHSFGTYLITKILDKFSDIRIDHLVLCGAVVRQKFPWHRLPNWPKEGVVNDCGTKDPWPIFAKIITFGFGASGRFGFQSVKVKNRYHDIDHSGFFNHDFFKKFWLPLIANNHFVTSEWNYKRKSTKWIWQAIALIEGGMLMLLVVIVLIAKFFR